MPLTPIQLEQYQQDGFLILENFFSETELRPIEHAIDQRVDALAERLFASGKIQRKYEEEGFLTRLTKLENEFRGAATLLHTGGVLPPEIAEVWSSKKLLDIVEQILGPEIAGHPVWNLRAKTPVNALATVPWHQDTAYLASGSEHTFQPTAWIPFVDANELNGAMQVVRGGHRSGKVFPHHLENTRGHRDSWYLYIEESDLPKGEIVTCEMKKGSVLLLNNLIPHRSLENYSDIIRWSIDLRWQRPGEISGMEGIKNPILMRTKRDPTYKPDWDTWAAVSRQVGLRDVLQESDRPVNESDAKVSGPWMNRWANESTNT
jgi:hypothetical protein